MSQMSRSISVGMGDLGIDIPIVIPAWERLKARNRLAERKYRPLRQFRYVEKDPCPMCDANFVHVVMMDSKHYCRKCNNTFDYRG